MKNVLIVGVILILLSACGGNSTTQWNEIYILVDNTEKSESKENIISTESLLDLVNNNGSITWKQLNAVSINRDTSISINLPQDATSLQKKDIIDPFASRIELLRKKFLGPTYAGTEGSNLYKPISETIAKLAKSNSNATLIVVSDMIEYSVFGNFYKDQPIEVIKEGLKASGDSLIKSPGVNVIILYDPEGDMKKETRFNRAMGIWKVLFDEAHISYEVKANL
jgi:hypothetical protein